MPQVLTEYDKKIGKKVRDYRVTHDRSQEELGKYLNLPKQAISRMENGKRRITAEELEKIALFFDVPIQLFLKDEYRYIYPQDTPYGVYSVYMAEFFDDMRKGFNIDAGKGNHTERQFNKFIDTLKTIRQEELRKQKSK